MTFEEFADWVDGALEDGTFLPDGSPTLPSSSRRWSASCCGPFASVVLAAADEKRLGAMPPPHPLLGDALAARARRAHRSGAPRHRTARLRPGVARSACRTVAARGRWRRAAGAESAGRTPRARTLAPGPRSDPACRASAPSIGRPRRPPWRRPLPRAPGLLPERLSASACEALRTCPYRFFALRLLRLREADELDDEFEKRDYGTWLHAVLHRFHATPYGAARARRPRNAPPARDRRTRSRPR